MYREILFGCEPDLHDVGRWGSILVALASSDEPVPREGLYVIGAVLEEIGGRLRLALDAASEGADR